jgi:hypothetical protein
MSSHKLQEFEINLPILTDLIVEEYFESICEGKARQKAKPQGKGKARQKAKPQGKGKTRQKAKPQGKGKTRQKAKPQEFETNLLILTDLKMEESLNGCVGFFNCSEPGQCSDYELCLKKYMNAEERNETLKL